MLPQHRKGDKMRGGKKTERSGLRLKGQSKVTLATLVLWRRLPRLMGTGNESNK